MGFFSWRCAKESDVPIMAKYAVSGSEYDFLSKVVVLFEYGDKLTGTYDGYGCVNDYDLVDTQRRWKMVIAKWYANETYDDLMGNDNDPGQGYFYGDDDLKRILTTWENPYDSH